MLLNVENQVHLFCLHCVYIPRINNALSQFLDTWNHHPLSGMSNLSPVKLWISGLSRNPTAEYIAEVSENNDNVQYLLLRSLIFQEPA